MVEIMIVYTYQMDHNKKPKHYQQWNTNLLCFKNVNQVRLKTGKKMFHYE